MKTKSPSYLLLCIFFQVFIQSYAQDISGSWEGNIQLPNANLGVVFNITENDNGELSAKMDVPQQGAANIVVGEIRATTDSLFIQVPSISGKYTGVFVNPDSTSGIWIQAGNKLTLNLKNTGEIRKAKRPQTPKAQFPYVVEEVEYTNQKSGLKLAGTLTIPDNKHDCPAVILISGSGAQDRDETIHEHKPFWVIADYLTRNGIAVLRVDDRGVGGSEGNTAEATSENFADDVLCGIDFLSTRPEINPQKIGLIGHSEGGLVAPIAASKSNNVSYIIMLAGPGIPGDSLLVEQTELLLKTSGIPTERIYAQLFLTRGIIHIIKTEKDTTKRSKSLRNFVTSGMYDKMDLDRQKMVDSQIARYDNNWISFFVSYDPKPTLEKVSCPVLALNGEKDIQVPPKSNLTAIENALKKGGNKDYTCMELSGLNHLFQNCQTGLPAEYAQIEETISEEVLELMKNWILKVIEKD